jgi:hypothetical protein
MAASASRMDQRYFRDSCTGLCEITEIAPQQTTVARRYEVAQIVRIEFKKHVISSIRLYKKR